MYRLSGDSDWLQTQCHWHEAAPHGDANLADPISVLSTMRNIVKPTGTVIVMDESERT